MTDKRKQSLFRMVLYLTATVISFMLISVAVGDSNKLGDEYDGLPVKKEIGITASDKIPLYTLWGPISFTKAGEEAEIEINAYNLNNAWIAGEVNLIEASHFEKDNQLLPMLN